MKVSSIQVYSNKINHNKINSKRENFITKAEEPIQPVNFKGENGAAAGLALGGIAGITSLYLMPPITAVVFYCAALFGCSYIGHKIEDKMNGHE